MASYDQFVPGQWIDNIDTSDFINLNKKPFFKEPKFLKNSSDASQALFEQLRTLFKQKSDAVQLTFSTPDLTSSLPLEKGTERLPSLVRELLENRIGFSENITQMKQHYHYEQAPSRISMRKTTYDIFEEVATSEIKKSIKMGVFNHSPATYTPSFAVPDIRSISLYGTKRLIKEKQRYLKKTEKHLQTHDWIRTRMDVYQQMDALKKFERFAKEFQLDASEPAADAVQAFSYSLLTIYYCFLENPSVFFPMGQLTSFFDIYLENDLSQHRLDETTAQELVDEFFMKVSFLRFVLSPGFSNQNLAYPQPFGETIGGTQVTKTTYRLLNAIRQYSIAPFSVRVIWKDSLPTFFFAYCENLLNEGVPFTFLHAERLDSEQEESVLGFGMTGVPGEHFLLDAGVCDLEKVLYIALNGGKEPSSNLNLMSLTQPVRTNQLVYDEVMAKFKEYISYVLSIYVETMNIVHYLSETRHSHVFRTALMSNQAHYKTQFGFTQLPQVSKILESLLKQQYHPVRNSKNWLMAIEPSATDYTMQEMIMADLVSYIEREIRKIPLHKKSTPYTRFYQGDLSQLQEAKDMERAHALPPEFGHASFPLNLIHYDDATRLPLIRSLFARDFSEINIAKHASMYAVNGMVHQLPTLLRRK